MALFAPPTKNLQLYPHQEEALERVRQEFRGGRRRILLVMPTGAGKSETAAKMHQLTSLTKGLPSLFAVHRIGLVDQFSKRLSKYGIPHGILMAGREYALHESIQVASLDTLNSRYFGESADGHRDILPDFRLIICDEAHTRFDMFKRLIDAYPNAHVIGLTATPALSSGRGMGEIYDSLVEATSIRWLTDNDYLVPARYFAPDRYNLEGVKIGANGEYIETSLEKAVDQPKLIGDIVKNWHQFAEGRPTVVFATSVGHSRHIENAFNEAGVPALHIDANTPTDLRESAYEAVANGELTVLTNYGVLDRGFDCPIISCCILARPVRHIAPYRQMIGRVLRTHPDKKDCIVIDHSGNVLDHGFVDEDIPWSLEPTRDVNETAREAREKNPSKEIACPKCKAVIKPSKVCPVCGHTLPVKEAEASPEEFMDGDLKEITERPSMADKALWWQMLEYIRIRRGYKQGWSSHKYRTKFGVWPTKVKHLDPLPPSDEVRRWVKSQDIRNAKRNYAAA